MPEHDILVPPCSAGPVRTLDQPPGERRVVVAAMICTLLVEVMVRLLGDDGSVAVGRIPVSLAAAPALVVVAAIGPRHLVGHPTGSPLPVGFWAAALIALGSASVVYTRAFDNWDDVAGIILSAFAEEAVYRLAAPVSVAAVLVWFGVAAPRSRTLGFLASGVAWVFLPGHVAQMDSPLAVASFGAAALLFAWVVIRSGSLLAAALVHAVMNLLAFAEWGDTLGTNDRRLLVAALLGLFVLAFGRPRPRAAAPSETVIDLRDPAPTLDLTTVEEAAETTVGPRAPGPPR